MTAARPRRRLPFRAAAGAIGVRSRPGQCIASRDHGRRRGRVPCPIDVCQPPGRRACAERHARQPRREARVVLWAQSSRSAASEWRRRSTASCCARRAFSAGTRSRKRQPDACRGSRGRLRSAAARPSPGCHDDGGCLQATDTSPDPGRRSAEGLPTPPTLSGAGSLGDSEPDESGFDPDFNASVLMPLYRPFYRDWFRVRMRGLEHVPASGAALVVANHSGVLPLDAIMLQSGHLRRASRAPEFPPARCRPALRDPAAWPASPGRAGTSGPARTRPGGCSPRASSSGCFPRASRESASPSGSGISCSALAGRVRLNGDRGGSADHPVRDRRRRGDLSDDRELEEHRASTQAARTSP